MDEPRVLLIDDDGADRALARALVQEEVPAASITEVDGAIGFAEALGRRGWDVAISDRVLSWADGIALLRTVKERHPRCHTVLFAREPPDEMGAIGERSAADGYLRRDSAGFLKLPGLVEAVRRAPADRPDAALTGGGPPPDPAPAASPSSAVVTPLRPARTRPGRDEAGCEAPGTERAADRFASPARSPGEPVPLKEAVLDALTRLRTLVRQTRAHVRTGPLPALPANRSEMTRLFRELIENALLYHHEPAGPNPGPVIDLRAEEHADGWLLSIRDNGRGMSAAERATAIGPRAPREGTGLAICRTIAARHGGSLWITSEPGRGTTVFVVLSGRATARDPAVTVHPANAGER